MPLATLTWNQQLESLIATTIPTYAEFLNKIDTIITASTHWKVNAKNLDAGNSRGWIELAPKSVLAEVADARVLILFSTGTVAGATGTERPLQACRQAPWNNNSSGLQCKMWCGMSDNAATALNVGPAGDPWTDDTPYGASTWTKLFPLNCGIPQAFSTMGIIESAEAVALYWAPSGGAEIQYHICGRLELDPVDPTNVAHWLMTDAMSSGDSTANATAWYAANHVNASQNPPLSKAKHQNSVGTTARGWCVTIINGTLYGVGRTQFATQDSDDVQAGLANQTTALYDAINLGGGIYGAGQNDGLVGILRQIRWGAPGYRGQVITKDSVAQGILLHWATLATGAKPWGLWFDNFA